MKNFNQSMRLLLLFMIVCIIGFSSTLQNAQAFTLQDTTLKIGLCYTPQCFLDSGYIHPVNWEKVKCAFIASTGWGSC